MSQKENTRASQRFFLHAETVLFGGSGTLIGPKIRFREDWARKSHSLGIPVRIWGAGESKWPFKFDLGVAVIGQNEILAGSGSFIRLNIFVPEGFGRFGTALHDFAIRLAIWGCRGP